jgi:exopolysaccharide biosynthesis WecB/TagA/CpsF family protein
VGSSEMKRRWLEKAGLEGDMQSDMRMIGPVCVTGSTAQGATDIVAAAVATRKSEIFAFCNAHTVNIARNSPGFANALRCMTVFNDGIGIEIARRMIYGERFADNLNGTDLTPRILAALPSGTRVFLLGSPRGVAERASAMIAARHPNVRIVGTFNGFFQFHEEDALADQIRSSGAQLVLVGMGQPRQEIWAAAWSERIGAVICCVGAFLDFTAGVVSRAPPWARRSGMEWAYRLALEPRRLLRRYIWGNPAFLLSMTSIALRHRLSRGSSS